MLKFNVGQRFGKLTIHNANFVSQNKKGILWNCLCDCGKLKQVAAGDLKSGNVQSCGCLQKQKSSDAMKAVTKKYNAKKKLDREEELLRTLLSELEE